MGTTSYDEDRIRRCFLRYPLYNCPVSKITADFHAHDRWYFYLPDPAGKTTAGLRHCISEGTAVDHPTFHPAIVSRKKNEINTFGL